MPLIINGNTIGERDTVTFNNQNVTKIVYNDATVWEQRLSTEGLEYELSSDGTYYTLVGIGTATDTDIIIPATYNGLPVTAIGGNAFYQNTSITSVSFETPSNMTSIAYNAFFGCSSLTSIELPDSLTTIGNYVFYSCTKLASVTIPDGVTSIGYQTFRYCSSLTEIIVTEGNENYSSEDGVLFNKDKTELIAYPIGKTDTSYVIPNGVISIDEYAFSNCTTLTSITIGEGITSIGDRAFYSCTAITEIYYNATACNDLSVDNYVFAIVGTNNTGITVTIGANVTKIPAYLFYPASGSSYAPNIVSVVFEEGSVCTSIGDVAFRYCTSLISVTIADSVTSIGSSAFAYCTSLKSIIIGRGVTELGSNAFYNCTALTAIYYNATACDDLGNSSFVFANAGINGNGIIVTIGANVEKIPAYMFGISNTLYEPNITYVLFEEGSVCSSISSYAFAYCSSLISIVVPDSVTSIGSSAFNGCSSLASISLPFVGGSANATEASSSTLFGYIFGTESYTGGTATEQYYDSSLSATYYIPTTLESVVIRSGSILYGAFYNCSNITSITMSSGVTSIGERAFYDCTSLAIVVMGSGITIIRNYAFRGCTSLLTVTIGNNVVNINAYAFRGCTSLTRITIPSNVTTIGWGTFYNCDALESATFAVTSGWSVYPDDLHSTSLSSSALADTSTAAEYLRETYVNYDWRRS